MTNKINDLYITSTDGLKLHLLDAGPRDVRRLPMICLPGLTRTNEDFRELIEALAFDPNTPRRVLALSSRGRGLSDRDTNPANYAVPVELNDLITVFDALDVERAVFIGTSRGGILTMALTAAKPSVIAGAVLNDIGPVLEMPGLLRIQSYVGKLPQPKDWNDAVRILKTTMEHEFPAFTAHDWNRYARISWIEDENALIGRSDPAIAFNLKDIRADAPSPPMWPLFDGLKNAPLLVFRGEHSDLLSRETVASMKARHPDLKAIEVPGVGHPPTLADESMIGPIRELAARCDLKERDA